MNIRSKNGTSVPQLGNCAQDPSRDPARVKSAGWMRSVAMRIVGGFGVLGTPARAGVAAAFLLVTLTAYAATNFPSPLTNTATVTVPAGTVNTNASCTNSGSSTLASQCTGSDSDTYSLDTVITKTGPASVIVGGAVTYTIKAWDNGPSTAFGAAIADTVPANLTGVMWTCAATGSATCGTASGSGNSISMTANLPPDPANSQTTPTTNFVTITVTATATSAVASFTNTATVTSLNNNQGETSTTNNTASVTTTMPTATLQLAKAWTNAISGNVASIGATTGLTNNTAAFTSTAPTASNSGTAVTVFVGETATLPAETMTTGTLANYATTVSCAGGGTLTGTNGQNSGNTVAIGAADAGKAIVCTYTNARKSATLKLQKTWAANSTAGNTATVTSSGFTNNATSGTSTATAAGNTTVGTAVTVYAGDSGTISEAFGVGSASNYSAALSCSGNTTALSGNTLTINPADTAIVCAETNTPKSATLQLVKTWSANSNANDQITVSTTGGPTSATVNSTATTAGNTSNGVAVTVYAGQGITLPVETFASGSQSNYTTTLNCSGNANALAGSTQPQTLTVSPSDTAIVCTYTNTRKSATLQLVKTWGPSSTAGNAISVATVGGINSATVTSIANASGNTTTGTAASVYAGENITLPAETFTNGSQSNYATKLTCSGNANALASTTQPQTLTVSSSDTAITCTYTNTPSVLSPLACVNTLYSIDRNTGNLYQINLTAGGAITGSTSSIVTFLATGANGLAVSMDGSTAYATAQLTSPMSVYIYSRTTNTVNTIATGITSNGTVIGGAVDPVDGNYYIASVSGGGAGPGFMNLYRFNTTTNTLSGQLAYVQFPTGTSNVADIAFDSAGVLYTVYDDPTLGAQLVRVNGTIPATAGSNQMFYTTIGNVGPAASSAGIAFGSNGQLYVDNTTTLKEINPINAAQIDSGATPSSFTVDLASCATPGSVTLQKNIFRRKAAGDQFGLSIIGGSPSGNTGLTSGSTLGLQTASGEVAGPVLTLPGASISLGESPSGTTSLANYNTSYSCTDQNATAIASGAGTSASFTQPAASATGKGSAITCTFTNTVLPIVEGVQKTSNGGVGTFNYTLAGLDHPTDTVTTTTSGVTAASGQMSHGTTGSPATLTETAVAGYTTTWSCMDANAASDGVGAASPVSGSGLTASLSGAVMVAGADWTCTFTNNKLPTVQAIKKSVGGVGAFGFSLAGLTAGSDTITTTVSGTAVSGAINTGTAGTPATVTETSGNANYATSISCVDANAASDGVGAGSPITVASGTAATIPASGMVTGAAWACSYTNNKLPTLTLAKTVSGGSGTNTFNYTLTGVTNTSDTTTNVAVGATVTSATAHVGSPGTSASITETSATSPTLSNYSTTWSCTDANSAVTGNAVASGSGTAIALSAAQMAPGAAWTCTYTNTRKQATLILKKTWAVNSIAGDAVTVTSSGFTNSATSGMSTATAAGNTTTGTSVNVFAGESGTISEAFGTGSASNYTAVLTCTGNTTALSGNTLTINPADTAITCTETNTRKSATLKLAKTWSANSIANDAISVTTTGAINNATLTATASAAGNTVTGTNVTIYAGEAITLPAETFTTGNQANYATTVACSGNANALAGSIPQQTLTVNPADAAITCTYTNTRKSATLTLQKSWSANSIAGDTVTVTSTGFTNNATSGTATATAAGNTATGTAVTVYAGESGTISEAFGTGSASNYTATLTCTGNATALSGNTLTVNPADTAITCTETNARKQATLTLKKTWAANSIAGNTVTVTSSGFTNNATSGTSTATAAGNTTTGTAVNVFAGESGTISEAFGTGSASNYTAVLTCTGNGTALSGNTLTINPADAAIICTETNTPKGATLTLAKISNGGTGTFAFTGLTNLSATTDSITTTTAALAQNGATNTVTALGTAVTAQETAQAGWNVVAAASVCTDANAATNGNSGSFGSITAGGALSVPAANIVAGAAITCTYTNTKLASLKIVKVVPTGQGTNFDFNQSGMPATATGTPNAATAATFSLNPSVAVGGTLTATQTYTNVTPGVTITADELASSNIGQYALVNVICTDAAGAPTGSTFTTSVNNGQPNGSPIGTATVNLVPGADVTCSFNNVRNPKIVLVKNTIGGDGTFSFTETTSLAGTSMSPASPVSLTTSAGAASLNTSVLGLSGSNTTNVTITETATPGYVLTNISCSDLGSSGTPPTATINLASSQAVLSNVGTGVQTSCTFTNAKLATITIKKLSVGATGSFSFSGGTNGLPASLALDTSTANPVAGGPYTVTTLNSPASITEAIPAGWALSSIQCVDASNTAVSVTADTSTGALTIPGSAITAGAALTCTFTNTKSGGITLTKNWVNGASGETVSLNIAGGSNAVPGSSTPATTTSATATGTFGSTITVSEAFAVPADANNYNSTLSCTGASATQSGLSGTFTMPASAVVCTWTNTRKSATLTLQKNWANGANGDTINVATTSSGVSGSASIASTANGSASQTGAPGAAATIYVGDTINLPAETFTVGNQANYTTTVTCNNASGGVVGVAPGSASFVVGTSDTAINCVYTNTRKSATLQLAKSWTNAISGNVASIGATTGLKNNTAAFTATAPTGATSGAAVTVFAGETATLPAETMTTGALANYATTVSCAGGGTLTGTNGQSSGNTVAIGAADAGNTIVCTYANARKAAQLNLVKTWSNGKIGDAVSVTTTGGTNNATLSSTSSGNNTDTGTAVTVYAGDAVTLPAETFTTGNQANYATTVACSGNANALAGNIPQQTLTVSPTDTTIACTYTNARRTATLQLAKSWTNGKAGDVASIGATTGLANNTTAFTATAPTAGNSGTAVTVFAGETATLPAETMTTGTLANYTTTLSCANGGTLTGTNGQNSGNTVAIGAADAGNAIVCTYANARKAVQFNLAKTWSNGKSGDAVSVTTTGVTNNATLNSTSSGSNATTGTAVTAYAGDSIVLPAETFTPAANSSNYTSTVACAGNATALGGSTAPQTLAIGSSDTSITCTYTNTMKEISFSVCKDNVSAGTFAPIWGWNSRFTIVVDSGTPFIDSVIVSPNALGCVGPVNVPYSATNVTITEDQVSSTPTALPYHPTGYPRWYLGTNPGSNTGYDTASTKGVLTNVNATTDDVTFTIAQLIAAGSDATVFINNQAAPTFTLAKISQGGTGTFAFSGITNTANATDSITTTTAGAQTVSTLTSPATSLNTDISATENVPSGWVVSSSNAACTDANNTTTGNPASFGTISSSGALDVPAANVLPGAAITCTFTNTKVAALAVTKSVNVGNGATVNTGQTLTYTIAVVVSNGVVIADDNIDDALNGATLVAGSVTSSDAVHLVCSATLTTPFCTLKAGTPAGTYTVTYQATVSATSGSNVTNAVTDTSGACPTTGAPASCTTTNPVGAVTLTKSVNPASGSTVASGQTLTYTLTVGVTGAPLAANDTIDDTLTGASLVAGSVTVTGAGGADTTKMTCTTPSTTPFCTLAAGAPVGTYTITYQATVSATSGQSVTNALTDTSGACPTTGAPANCSTSNPVGAVTLTKSVNPASGSTVATGQTLTYTLTVGVTGAPLAANDTIDDTLTGASLVAGSVTVTGAGGADTTKMTCMTPSITPFCTLAAGAPVGTYTITYQATVTATSGSNVTNALTDTSGACPTTGAPANCSTSNPVGAVTLTKSVNPATGSTVTSGQTLTYTLTVGVTGAPLAANDTIDDTLTGASLVAGSVTVTGAGGADTTKMTCTTPSTTPFCTLAAGAPVGTYTITYQATVTAASGASVSNAVTDTSGACPTTGAPASCSTTNPVGAVTLTKSVNPASGSTVATGQTLTYTLTVGVTGAPLAANDTINDTLTSASLVAGSVTVTGAGGADTTKMTCTTPSTTPFCTLAAGAPVGTYTITYQATVTATSGQSVTNALTDTSGACPTTGAPTSCSTTNPVGAVTLTKSVNPTSGSTVTTGQTLTYTLTVGVTGAPLAANDTIDDTLTGASLVTGSVTVTGAGGADTTKMTCTTPSTTPFCTLAAGAPVGTYTITYQATVNAASGASVTNALTDTSGACPTTGAPANCSTTNPVGAVTLTKSVNPASGSTVATGQTLTYTLTVGVTGAPLAANDTIDDTLTGASLVAGSVTVTGAGGADTTKMTCTTPSTTPFCTLAAGAPVGTYTITYQATVTAASGASVSNAVTDTSGACPTTGAPASCSTTNPVGAVTLTKSVNPASGSTVASGQTLTYTLTVGVTGAPLAANDTIDDTLTGASLVAGSVTVTGAGGADTTKMTCTTPGTVPFCTLAAGAPVGTYTITYQATVTAASGTSVSNAVTDTSGACPTTGAPASCTTTNPVGTVTLTKSVNPAPGSTVATGQTLTYTLTVGVTGAPLAANDTIDDTLTGASLVAGSVTVTGAGGADTTKMTCTTPGTVPFCTLAAGAPVGTYTITYQATVSATSGSNVTNALTDTSGACPTTGAPANCSTTNPVGAVTLTKSVNPASGSTVASGQTLTYTLTVGVTGAPLAANDTIDDTLTGASLVAGSVTVTGAGGADTTKMTCTTPSTTPFCTLAAGAPVGTYTITYQATVNAASGSNVSNAVTDTSGACPTTGAPASCSTTNPVGAVTLTKSVNPASGSTVATGQTLTYTLTVGVTGAPLAANDTINDTLTSASLVAGSVTVTGAGGADTTKMTCTTPSTTPFCTLAAGAPVGTYTITYQATVTAASGASVSNAVTDTSGACPTIGAPASCTTTNPVGAVTLTKSVNPASGSTVASGQTLTYTLTVGVTGAPLATNDTIDDTLTGASLVAGSVTVTGAGGADTTKMTCTTPSTTPFCTLAAGAPVGTYTITYQATVTATSGQSVTNVVTDTSSACPAANPPASCSTTNKVGTLSVTKSVDVGNGATVTAGQTLTYTITAVVSGSTLAADDPINDTLTGASLVAGSVTSSDATHLVCTTPGTTPFCTLKAGAPVGTYTVTYKATVTAASGTNVTNVVTDTSGVCPAANPPTSCTTTNPVGAVTLTKSVNPASGSTVATGQTLTYTLTVGVTGAPLAANDTIDDTLTGASLVAGSVTVTGVGGADTTKMTCTTPSTTPFCTLAAGAPVGTYTITYQATVSATSGQSVTNALTDTSGACPAANPPASCSTTNKVGTLSVTKSVDVGNGATVASGQTLTYTITAVVSGGTLAADDPINDTLAGASLVAGSVTSSDATNLVCTTPGTTPFCTLKAGAPVGTYTVNYKATVTAASGASVSNAVTDTSGACPTTGAPASCTTTNPVGAVTLTKSVNPASGSTVASGQTLTYTLTVGVTGAPLAANDTIDDTLTGASLVAGSVTSSDATHLVCTTPGTTPFCTLKAGAPVGTYTVTYKATVTAASGASVTNVVTDTSGACPAVNPPASCSTTNKVGTLSVTKSVDVGNGATVTTGQTLTYTITAMVSGGTLAADDPINDTLAGASLVAGSVTSSDATHLVCTTPGTTPFCTLKAGAPVGTYTVTYKATVTAASGTNVTNVVTDTSGGCPAANPPASCRTTNPPNLFDPPFISKAVNSVDTKTLRWSITVDNNKNAAAQVTEIRDPLPAGMTFVSGVVTCQTFGSSTVSTCVYDAANNRIVADAVLASDLGVSDADTATAPNRLVLSFNAQYLSAPAPVTNIAQACWDAANNSTNVSSCAQAVSAQAHYTPPSGPVKPIPVDSRWMLWSLSLLLLLAGIAAGRHRMRL